MMTRSVILALLIVGVALAAPPADTHPMPNLVDPVAADDEGTCDGWPPPTQKVLNECPNGPTPW